MSDILQQILQHKIADVRIRQNRRSLASIKSACERLDPPLGFVNAIRRHIDQGRAAVIAEIKKASPSKGIIRASFSVDDIARSYAEHGATCLSVLTDESYFQGHDRNLRHAKGAANLPVLRKDFMVDPYQIYESRLIGADAVLLIVAALEDTLLAQLAELAHALQMDVLVEVHDEREMERALKLPCPLIGINNRNLRTFQSSLNTTLELLEHLPDDRLIVTESGIKTRADIELMRRHGVHCFLVGETLMRAAVPGEKLQQLFLA